MKRRRFIKMLTATPAAFLVGQYGMPGGGEAPAADEEFAESMPFSLTADGPDMGNGGPIEIRSGADSDGEILLTVINHDTVPHDISFWF